MRRFIAILLMMCAASVAAAQTTPGAVQYPTALDTATTLFETADNAATVLTLSISPSATTANVTSTTKFPATGSFVIDNEIIYYTGKTQTALTGLLRGRAGTAAAAHPSGSAVRSPVISAHRTALVQAILAMEQKLGLSSSAPSAGQFLKGAGPGSSVWGPITDSDLPATLTGKALSGGTATGLTCIGCTGLGTPSSAGTASTGDVTFAAGTDGSGDLVVQTGGVERARITGAGVVTGFSGRTYFASKSGAALDSNLTSGGGTDDTAALQAVLNLASGGTPVHLVIDGPARTGQLVLYSNTTVECVRGGGLYLKNGANQTLLRNANRSATTVTDSDITIRGCTLNGNSANQTGIGLFSTQEANGNLIGLVQLFGVNNVRLESLHLVHSKSIAAWVGNATNVYVNNLYIDNNVSGQFQQGGLQIDGPASRIAVSNIVGTTQDDLFAFNSNDCSWVNGAFTGLGPYVACGAITDMTVNGIVGINAYSAVRFFNSVDRIDRVRISNISGTFSNHVFNNDPLTIGPGNVGTIVVDGVNASVTSTVNPSPAFINIYGKAEHLVFRDINVSGLIDTRPVVHVAAGAQIDNLDLSGIGIVETTSASAGFIPVTVAGTVHRLTGSDWRWQRDLFLAHSEALLKLTAASSQVEELNVSVIKTNRVNRVVYVAAGRLSTVGLTNVRQSDSLGGITVSGTVGVVSISNWLGDYAVPFSGTAGKKLGDAFPADTAAPTYSTGVATGGAPFVVVTFSEPINGNNLAAGVTIKKNAVAQTISSAKRRESDATAVEYVLSSNIAGGDTVTWEYAAGSGNAVDLQSNPLANVSAQTVTVSRTGYVYDTFTAADGTAMNGRAPSPLTAGNNWATLIGTAGSQTVRGGRLHLDGSAGTQSVVADAGAANVIHYATLTPTRFPDASAGVGLIFRATNATNYWLVWLTKDSTTLFKVVAGVTSTVQTVSAPHYPGVHYLTQCTANVNAITCTVNGGETVTATDSFNATATKHGVHAAGAVMAADDFTVVSAP